MPALQAQPLCRDCQLIVWTEKARVAQEGDRVEQKSLRRAAASQSGKGQSEGLQGSQAAARSPSSLPLSEGAHS